MIYIQICKLLFFVGLDGYFWSVTFTFFCWQIYRNFFAKVLKMEMYTERQLRYLKETLEVVLCNSQKLKVGFFVFTCITATTWINRVDVNAGWIFRIFQKFRLNHGNVRVIAIVILQGQWKVESFPYEDTRR